MTWLDVTSPWLRKVSGWMLALISASARYEALSVNARCEALFVSDLQRSDDPDAAALAKFIRVAVRRFGVRGCAAQMAQEFGDHPETAAARMRWIRQTVAEVPAAWPRQIPARGAQLPHCGSPHDTGPMPRAA